MGVNIQLALRDCYDQVQQRAEEEMARITLQEVLDLFNARLFRLEQNASRSGDTSAPFCAIMEPATIEQVEG